MSLIRDLAATVYIGRTLGKLGLEILAHRRRSVPPPIPKVVTPAKLHAQMFSIRAQTRPQPHKKEIR